MSSKRYKLFKAADDGGPAPCAFFKSPDGCKNGSRCKFLHELPSAYNKSSDVESPIRERSPSVVSSESDRDFENHSKQDGRGVVKPLQLSSKGVHQEQTHQKVTEKKTKNKKDIVCEFYSSTDGCKSGDKCRFLHEQRSPTKDAQMSSAKTPPAKSGASFAVGTKDPVENSKKKNRRSGDGDIFAAPKRAAPSIMHQPAKKARNSQEESPRDAQKVQVQSQPIQQTQKTPSKLSVTPSFRQLDLPIAPFSLPGFQIKGSQASSESNDPNTLPLPKSTPEGRKWLDAVVKTRQNSRYANSYDFKKMKEQDASNGAAASSEWIKAKPFGEWCRNNPQTIAIDCEMCETQEPVTGRKNHRALCRLSIVNGDNPEEVLLDTLVKPAWPVTNYRSWVNGIEMQHLENVAFTIEHAQAFLMALCSEETVILGHAVYNDLAAMRMEHHCAVDSSYLFAVKNEPGLNPGLKDITKAFLSMDMPKTHDSVNDALMSFRCLEVWLAKNGDVEPVERIQVKKNNMLASSQLFVHRIPTFCQKNHLEIMFKNHTAIQPVEIDDFEFNGEHGKTVLTFSSSKHANLAFTSLDGEEDPDTSGRLQKKIFLRNGSYIRVRKMVHERSGRKSDVEPKTVVPSSSP